MEAESRKRVGETSTRRNRPNKRKLFAPGRGSKKKTRSKKEAEPEKYYSLADPGILDQKEENGKVYYLCNWADDPETGEKYLPSWEPYHFVAKDVIASWQSRRWPAGQLEHNQTTEEREEDTEQQGTKRSTPHSTQDSQPPRPAKRQKITYDSNQTPEEQGPTKKPRRVGTVESARFQSVSQEHVEQEEVPNEIKDSYEDDQQLSSPGGGKARVEISVPDNFNPDAYARVVTSSQLSQLSYLSQISQSPVQSSLQLQTQTPRHKYSSTIWDEDIEGVIPDSQEQPGSSSYKPSETALSKTATSSRQNTEADTGTDLEELGFSNTQTSPHRDSRASGTVDSEFAEPLDSFTQASYTNIDPHSSSVPTESSKPPSSHPQQISQESRENRSQDVEHPCGLLDETRPPSDFTAPQGLEQASSPALRTSSDLSLRLPESSPEERDLASSQAQPAQTSDPEVQETSSSAFATQLPLQRDEGDHIIPSPDVSLVESNHNSEEPFRQASLALEEDSEESQTIREESHQRQSFPPTERSVSSFEATWNAARVISATPRPSQPSLEAPATPVQTPRDEDPEDSSQEKTPEGVSKQAVPGLSVNTQRSPSTHQVLSSQKGSAEQRSQESSGSLPSPPFESVGSGTEQFAQLTSQNRPPTPPEQSQRSELVGNPNRHCPSESVGSGVDQFSDPLSTPPQSALTAQSIENPELHSLEQPAQFTSQIRPSTPIEPVRLAQAIQDIGRNRSLRAPEIIDLTMDDPPPVNPVLAKLQLRKAEAAARRAAERAASASRSLPQSPAPLSPAPAPAAAINEQAIAANQTLPLHETIEEVTLPGFEPMLSPKASPEAELEADATPTSLRIISQGQEEYFVPLPMVSYARDIYVNALRTRRSQRYAFLTDEVFDASLVKEIDSMIDELDSLCNHQDLIVDDFSTQKMETVERQAKWAENVSTKCIFLAEFLSLMQTEDKRIAILVRPGRMLEILEALFEWHGFVYNRADKPNFGEGESYIGNTAGGPMRINLYPTQGEIMGFERPSIIIGFDSTYPSKAHVIKDLQGDPTSPNRLVPFFSLIVTHSIEHLEKCFDGNLEPIERKIKLVSCLTQIGDGVGKLSGEHYGPPAAAKVIVEYVVNGTIEGTWPLLPMPDIEDLDLNIESSQLAPPEEEPSGSAMPPQGVSLSHVSQLGLKRELDTGDSTNRDSPKRQKLTPVPGEQELSHVSDTVLHTSSGNQTSTPAEVNEIIAKTNTLDDEQQSQFSMLLKKINELEIQLRSREATESEIRQINQDLETRCQDYESSIASIQPKYQEALNDRGRFEHELNLALLRQTNLRKDLDNKDAELTKLREQKTALDAELTDARAALSSSSIPEIAEMGKLKEELAKERSEKERLQRRLTNMQGDLEYMRNNYQNSSIMAAEHASENQALQAEVAELREKAKENTVRIHEIQESAEIEEYVRRIRELKEENGELERELERKSEELKALMNGRRATRGTSVPRSPRMGTGGTMSPGPRPMGRAMQMGGIGMAMGGVIGGGNGGSRGNSPAPGELGGFRGTGTFVGEALFQERGAPGGVRWGNHLQQ